MQIRKWGRCSLCASLVPGARCETCAARLAVGGTQAELVDRVIRGVRARAAGEPRCSACGDLGPCAREDGHRYDGAGLDCRCPDCGVSTQDVHTAAALGCHPQDLGVRS